MAKRTSNRAARQLLCVPVWLSNRKQMSSWPSTINTVYFADKGKPSRSQRRADKRRYAWLRENASTDCDYIGIADHNPQFHC
ncbi:hypothetical protein [Serratia ficaria]|uniref:hypothetical protein n=1 Tax=Serratia ficaria TaxID=61651 RepID=UPI0021BB4D32|nr:hypothetical protein [Serratia ficaria]